VEGQLRAAADEQGLYLIETAFWNGYCCPRLAGHLARLSRSAAALGWGCDGARVTQALRGLPGQAARLRLTLDRSGTLNPSVHPLPAPIPLWRLGLAPERLAADDPWLSLKSSRRGLYDRTRAQMAPGLDELLFLNDRDEVCEGTITNIFYDRGQGLCTPPVTSGLLPGVLRAEMLAAGCRVEALPASALPRVRLWVGNALRGLCPARWIGADPMAGGSEPPQARQSRMAS
jgi:4-amino-4-deoxychorismate lyase